MDRKLERRIDLFLIWLLSLVGVSAVMWGKVAHLFPQMSGLSRLSELSAFDGISRVGILVACAIWLSVGKWHTRDRFLILQGMAYSFTIVGILFTGIAYAAIAAFVANICSRAIKDSALETKKSGD